MKRITFLATAAMAAMAILAPGSAFAGGAHLLGSYKVEKHIDLEGEQGTADYTISCANNDIAVDGMWRIDNVDQDNDYSYDPAPSGLAGLDVLNSVEPVEARATSVDTWKFQFLPLSGGDVQGKLWLTCLPRTVHQNNGHTVSWLVTGPDLVRDSSGGGDATLAYNTVNDTYGKALYTNSTQCNTGEMAVAPGFQWLDPDTFGKPFMRFPTSTSTYHGWKWGFFSSAPAGSPVRISWMCLKSLSDWSNAPLTTGHRHKIVTQYRNVTSPNPDTVKADRTETVQVICGEHYKAMLGAWDFGYSGYTWDISDYFKKLWYLGMDPRPKARAFKLMNTDPSVDYSTVAGTLGAICFKDKTT